MNDSNDLYNEFIETVNNNLTPELNPAESNSTVIANLVQQFNNGDFLMYNEEKKEFYLVTNTPDGIKIHGKKRWNKTWKKKFFSVEIFHVICTNYVVTNFVVRTNRLFYFVDN